jgi:hypothetical protein
LQSTRAPNREAAARLGQRSLALYSILNPTMVPVLF